MQPSTAQRLAALKTLGQDRKMSATLSLKHCEIMTASLFIVSSSAREGFLSSSTGVQHLTETQDSRAQNSYTVRWAEISCSSSLFTFRKWKTEERWRDVTAESLMPLHVCGKLSDNVTNRLIRMWSHRNFCLKSTWKPSVVYLWDKWDSSV